MVDTHRIHVWYIYLHVPYKLTMHVGNYSIHGSFGIGKLLVKCYEKLIFDLEEVRIKAPPKWSYIPPRQSLQQPDPCRYLQKIFTRKCWQYFVFFLQVSMRGFVYLFIFKQNLYGNSSSRMEMDVYGSMEWR